MKLRLLPKNLRKIMHSLLKKTLLLCASIVLYMQGFAQLKERNPAEADYKDKLIINTIRDYLPGKEIKSKLRLNDEYLFYQTIYVPKVDWKKVKCKAEIELGSERIKQFTISTEGRKEIPDFKKLVFELCGSYDNPRPVTNGNFYFWNWYDGFGQLRGEMTVDTLNYTAKFTIKPIF